MTDAQPLFLQDPYLQQAPARVVALTEDGGVIVDQPLFYATGGGQPGDTGRLDWEGGSLELGPAGKREGTSVLVPLDPEAPRPAVGTDVMQFVNWPLRLGHMRVHTALHLLSVVIPLPVSGGSIAADKGRLDFNMPEAPQDKAALEDALNALIARDLEVTQTSISDAELDANPDLVKTMSVSPPRGSGRVRLVRIGTEAEQVDLQPCGGTHVARTSEIGRIRLGKVEKKGRENRRVYIHLVD